MTYPGADLLHMGDNTAYNINCRHYNIHTCLASTSQYSVYTTHPDLSFLRKETIYIHAYDHTWENGTSDI